MHESVHRANPSLGATKERLSLDDAKEIGQVSLDMAMQATRELLILGPTLDPSLYDHPPFAQAVQRLALARPNPSVRILLCDPRVAIQNGHRLIELARRLTSRIAILRIAEEDRDRTEAFLVADALGYVHRRQADRMEATANYNDALEARRLRLEFEQLWERGSTDPELRRLFI